ncbi:nucleoside triphosphate pyrophosphohydrolase [Aquibacillus sp. 3ASR75-11]|uniref:Nucleoside triphosphate pyrophosphohydrolase n=1 Tax=Terrihalobacillus insolitus TaxID=2950438 RepID=A0A9X3WUJ1_9BACI|nr:nucleoside triphosphate pyrophosphohydrolase [Terrihalobacillus insolitus]MDC3413121.1 nucleoside triphosphate pyrophosphohydrolase [Terrihalobacillus insolitus]MDC3424863.1 nucleoside triphosphate pyrophosphohydrolase [Terrihalobacillus insolitus]
MPIYNKLVRDLIPQIIEKQGIQFSTKVLDHDDYIAALQKKLVEEVEEYIKTDNNQDSLEELADVLELIHAIAKIHGSSIDQVEEIRQQKAIERGVFNDKVFLLEVEDD